MSPEIKKEIKLEIAHVLFVDIVGYSKLLINEQHELLQELNQIVRTTETFRAAEAAGKLIRLPTGDGMALAFATTPEAPVQCALEISKALKSHPELRVRMGIPVVIERTYNAPVEKVWTALTDVEQVREWYFDQVREWYFDLNEFIPEVGFEFGFVVEHEGNRYDHRCKVTEVIPQRKIAYTWRYEGHEGDSLVTIELFPDGDKTRLRLTHEGLETFPKTPAFARENFEKGWTAIIGSELKEFVERKP